MRAFLIRMTNHFSDMGGGTPIKCTYMLNEHDQLWFRFYKEDVQISEPGWIFSIEDTKHTIDIINKLVNLGIFNFEG